MKRKMIFVVVIVLLAMRTATLAQQIRRLAHTGSLSLLRVHELGIAYGSGNNRISVEVVTKFSNKPNNAFGFKLRDDQRLPAREGMLAHVP